MTVVAVDSRAEVLDAARELRPGLDRLAGLELRVADGRVLPFPDEAFDVAHASLVLHHLEPRDAVAFLCELARVSRAGVVVNDLSRGRLHWAAAWALGRTLFRSAYTRHDAPLSVRRAYTAEEMADLLDDANLRPIRRARGLAGHRYAIAAVRR
jgi:ubiquinone/menaquinone biosynthesis C-methylase UbiE